MSKGAPNFGKKESNLLWIDAEVSDESADKGIILECAIVITDTQLNIIAKSDDIVVKQSEEALIEMGEWGQKRHSGSGLMEAVANSQIGIKECEDLLVNFLKDNNVAEGVCPMAGDDIFRTRNFIAKFMPKLHTFFSSANIDVSVLRELCKRWNPLVCMGIPQLDFQHRCLHDILQAIAELHFYYKKFTVVPVDD
eukprot:Nk52_evm34s2356 gene=Nk52_evmTU34s2356